MRGFRAGVSRRRAHALLVLLAVVAIVLSYVDGLMNRVTTDQLLAAREVSALRAEIDAENQAAVALAGLRQTDPDAGAAREITVVGVSIRHGVEWRHGIEASAERTDGSWRISRWESKPLPPRPAP